MSLEPSSSNNYFEQVLPHVPGFFQNIQEAGEARLIGEFIEQTDWEDYWFETDIEYNMPTMTQTEMKEELQAYNEERLNNLLQQGYMTEFGSDQYTVPLEAMDELWEKLNQPQIQDPDRIEESIIKQYNIS